MHLTSNVSDAERKMGPFSVNVLGAITVFVVCGRGSRGGVVETWIVMAHRRGPPSI